MKILVTGAAGFIGYHTVDKLLSIKGNRVIGVDSMNNYYSKKLKIARINNLKKKYKRNFIFKKIDLSEQKSVFNLFKNYRFNKVINLAAQAGVRYSLKNPKAYFNSNLSGFFNILEACRKYKIHHLVSASTSSVYGANKQMPFKVTNTADHPIQFYAATKRSNEILAHSYSYLFKMPVTLLRFFTVYGPWGRPDMSLFIFVKNILQKKPIEVYNFGKHSRDFTYIDDIVSGVVLVLNHIPSSNNSNHSMDNVETSSELFKIFNIGNNKPIELLEYVSCIEEILGKKAIKILEPMQLGDVEDTWADIEEMAKIGYGPTTDLKQGMKNFIEWFLDFYDIKKY